MTSQRKQVLIQAAILIAALGFLILGILRGEPRVVLGKAVKICLECIGMG